MVVVWRSLPRPLRWLLTSDIFISACEGLVDVFLVVYRFGGSPEGGGRAAWTPTVATGQE